MPEWHFLGAGIGLTGFNQPLCPVFWCDCRPFACGECNPDVYAVNNLRRKAYKFARPISTITWAAFFASPR
jgi:hypothetical protein